MLRRTLFAFVLVATFFAAGASFADEGMWTFDSPPLEKIQKAYGVTLTPQWLDHVRLSSVRLNFGSASFVSPNGLIATNHHVAAKCVQDLSTEKTNYLALGYGVRTKLPEKKCPGMEALTLVGYDDVTHTVQAAIPATASDAEAAKARRAALARLEKECKDKTGLTCEAVTMHGGGQYWIYRYQTYRDVRLVFAPEMELAFFGGDPDNFNYPRFCLDFAFLRAYDDHGQPARTPNFLTPKLRGVKEGDPIFISGHPGSSQRFYTVAQLEFFRDVSYPWRLARWRRLDQRLTAYAQKSPENARRAMSTQFYIQNSIKAYKGNLAGLNDAKLLAAKRAEEDALRRRVEADPKLAQLAGGAWDQIARVQKIYAQFAVRLRLLHYTPSRLLSVASDIVRLGAELPKPNDQRFEEYQDSNLDTLYDELYADEPVYADLEEVLVGDFLAEMVAAFGADDPATKAVLRGRTPAEVAHEVVAGSKLYAPADRKKLVEGGAKAVAASDDPAILVAAALDPYYRALRKRYEDEVKIVEERAGQKIAQARFAAGGNSVYPDATFTLRLSYGHAAGYESGAYATPYRTTFYGLFNRYFSFDGRSPFSLPAGWVERAGKLDLATTFDMVDTAETFGGNSGSPEIDKDGRLIGLVFDGNIESLAIEFIYDDVAARSVSVSVDAIAEALRKVYGRDDLATEFLGGE
jgi:hypothetical protein